MTSEMSTSVIENTMSATVRQVFAVGASGGVGITSITRAV